MSCGLNQQPFEMFPPGGTTPGGGNIDDGTVVNNTTRWDGTKWVESDFLTNDGTKVGVGVLTTYSLFNSEGSHSNFTGRFWNTGAGGAVGAYSHGAGTTLTVGQNGTGAGIDIGMHSTTSDDTIYIASNKTGGDHLRIHQHNGIDYEDMFRIMFTGEILSTAYKTTSAHPAGYHSLYVDSATGEIYAQAASTGTIIGASNVGTGDGWWKDNSSGTLRFKSVLVANGLTKTAGTDEITISMPTASSTNTLANSGGNWTGTSLLRVGDGGTGTGYVGIGTTPTTASHLSMSAATGKIVQFLQSFTNADILQLSKGGGSGNAINVDNYGTSTAVDIYSDTRTALVIQLGSTNTNSMISANKIGGANFRVDYNGNVITTGNMSVGSNAPLKLNGNTIGGTTVSMYATPLGVSYDLFLPGGQGTAGQFLANDGLGNLGWVSSPLNLVADVDDNIVPSLVVGLAEVTKTYTLTGVTTANPACRACVVGLGAQSGQFTVRAEVTAADTVTVYYSYNNNAGGTIDIGDKIIHIENTIY